MWISFIVASIIATCTGLSYVELSSMFVFQKRCGICIYIYVKNAFGNNAVAFIAGWRIILVAIVSAASVAIGFSGHFPSPFPHFHPVLSATGLVLILKVVNFIGIRELVWMNTTFAFTKLVGFAIMILAVILFGSY